MTTAVSLKEFRAKTDEILDSVIEGDETAYLTSTPENRAALAQSLKEVAEGKTVEVDL